MNFTKDLTSSLPQNLSVPVLRGLHWLGHGILLSIGFQWEVRRTGDLKIGLWRKNWASVKHASGSRKKTDPVRRLVIVPGFGDTPFSWLTVLGMLTPVTHRHYEEVILLDFPGFAGRLHNEKPFHSMDLLRESVCDIFDSLKPHTVIGHSLGGWLVAHYLSSCGESERPKNAKRHYQGPSKAIFVNPSGAFVDEESKKNWEEIFRSVIRDGFPSLRPHIFKKEPLWFRFLITEFSKFLSHEETIQFMESVKDEHLVGDRLKNIRTPSWVIWTEHDSMIPASCAEVWVREINQGAGQEIAKGVVLKGSGHSPQLEKPGVLAAILGQIMAEREPHALGWRWWQQVGVPTQTSSPDVAGEAKISTS